MSHAPFFAIPLWQQTLINIAVGLAGVALACALALYYLRQVRVERPPVGTFNFRDITILLTFVVLLPFLYAALLPGRSPASSA